MPGIGISQNRPALIAGFWRSGTELHDWVLSDIAWFRQLALDSTECECFASFGVDEATEVRAIVPRLCVDRANRSP